MYSKTVFLLSLPVQQKVFSLSVQAVEIHNFLHKHLPVLSMYVHSCFCLGCMKRIRHNFSKRKWYLSEVFLCYGLNFIIEGSARFAQNDMKRVALIDYY